jgi:hypothetical protein
MYYPYATIQSKETLKLSLLYFDKIHILSPDYGYSIGEKSEDLYRGKEIYEELGDNQILKPPRPYKLFMETKYSRDWSKDPHEANLEYERKQRLEKEREIEWKNKSRIEWENKSSNEKIIISQINPTEIFEKHFDKFEEAVLEDLKDDNFKELTEGKKWLLFNEKASPSLMNSFRNKITPQNNDEILVDGDLAESILLNHAIFASIDKKLTPFTDEPEHNRLFNRKMQRNYELIKDDLFREGYIEDIKQNLLAKRVMEINLSGVKGVEYSEILNFRDDNKKELKSFRTEIGSLSTKISKEPWTIEFEREVEQVIKSEINPKVQDLENEAIEFKDNMIVKYGKKVIPIAITLGVTAYAGVPLSLAVLGSTLLDKLRGESIYDIILEDWKDWRHQNRNSLTYLLNLNKLSS